MFFSQRSFKAWDTVLILHAVFVVLIFMNIYLLIWYSLLLAFLVKYKTIICLVWIIRGIPVDKRQGNRKPEFYPLVASLQINWIQNFPIWTNLLFLFISLHTFSCFLILLYPLPTAVSLYTQFSFSFGKLCYGTVTMNVFFSGLSLLHFLW